jgi:hypothetical protein
MAAGENQPQSLVRVDVALSEFDIGRRPVPRLELGETLQRLALARQVRRTADPVERLVAGDRRDPRAGVVGEPVPGPALERDRERLLDRVLGEVEVTERRDQRRDRPSRLAAEQAADILIGVERCYEAAPSAACSLEPRAS